MGLACSNLKNSGRKKDKAPRVDSNRALKKIGSK